MIWRSMWTSLHGEFETCIKAIKKVAKEVHRVAEFEHMFQAREEANGSSQRGSVHARKLLITSLKRCVGSELSYSVLPEQ
jgi:hypothetical protein